MENTLKPDSSQRFYGLDFLKFFFIVTIVIFHVWENLMYRDVMELPLSQSFYTYYGKILSLPFHYAGPFLAALSFFLFGYRDSKFSFIKWAALFIGVLIIQFNAESFEAVASAQSWGWDVYSYLVLAYGLVYLLPKNKKSRLAIIAICTVILLFSPQFYSDIFSNTFGALKSVWILNREAKIPNGWFLLPWIFLPILMFNLGHLTREDKEKLQALRPWELPTFIICFLILWKATDSVPFLAGPRFYEFLFWQKSAYFWLHFISFLFFIRLQFSKPIKNFFNHKVFRLISKLNWVKHLWFCYLFHFAIIQLLEPYYVQHMETPYILDLIALTTLISTELVSAFLFFLHSRRQR